MTKVNMDLTKFNELLDQHGPVLDDWPAGLQRQAQSLLAASADATDALTDAETLSNLLGAMPPVAAPDHLAGRIVARAAGPQDPWQSLIDWLGAGVWRGVLAAALPLALGFAVGLAQPSSTQEDAYLAADVGLMAFSSSYEEPSHED